MSAASLSEGCVLGGAVWRSAESAAFNARRPGLPDGTESHHRCRREVLCGLPAVRRTRSAPSPLVGEGWGGGGCGEIAMAPPARESRHPHPPPPPPPGAG